MLETNKKEKKDCPLCEIPEETLRKLKKAGKIEKRKKVGLIGKLKNIYERNKQ